MHPEKNFELAIEAAVSTGYPLTICGSTGRGEAQVQALKYVEKLKAIAGNNVQFELDIQDSVYIRLLQECSVYLHPGRKEVFPLTPLEAMACGKPVIALNAGGTPECVGDIGVLLGDDPKDWSREMKRTMESRELRAELGERAYGYAKQFTWERTADMVTSALASVLRANG
jgi:glycosyltransferase involved in cell wall biosynthesis